MYWQGRNQLINSGKEKGFSEFPEKLKCVFENIWKAVAQYTRPVCGSACGSRFHCLRVINAIKRWDSPTFIVTSPFDFLLESENLCKQNG